MMMYVLIEIEGNGEAEFTYGCGEHTSILGIYSFKSGAINAGNQYLDGESRLSDRFVTGNETLPMERESNGYYHYIKIIGIKKDKQATKINM